MRSIVPEPTRLMLEIRAALLPVTILTAALVTLTGPAPTAFAFRMFNQSSRITVALFREVMVDGRPRLVHVKSGEWIAKDRFGVPRRFGWGDRVKNGELRAFDRAIHASYGVEAQTERFHAALLDVASHLSDDTETTKLVLEVTQRKNGHVEQHVRFEASTRP